MELIREEYGWLRGRLMRVESWIPSIRGKTDRIDAVGKRVIDLERQLNELRISHLAALDRIEQLSSNQMARRNVGLG